MVNAPDDIAHDAATAPAPAQAQRRMKQSPEERLAKARVRAKARYWAKRDEILEKIRTDPVVKQKARERAHAYYWAHREEIRAKKRKIHPRETARLAGEKYYRAKHCHKHGDVLRFVSTRQCVECCLEWGRKYYSDNPQKYRQAAVDYYHANATVVLARKREARFADIEAHRAKIRAYRAANRDAIRATDRKRNEKNRERLRQQQRAWRLANLEHVRALKAAQQMTRNARQKRQMPNWLTKDQVAEIYGFYESGNKAGLVVDHIVPLGPCRICEAHGLHVPWNLQLLEAGQNAQKNNRCQECWQ